MMKRVESRHPGKSGPAVPAVDEEELVDTILKMSRVIVGIAARSLGSDGEDISLPQFRGLVLLATQGPLRPADLAVALSVDPSTVTRLCDRLVAKKLISRRRDRADRREVRLHLSAGGRRLLDAVTDLRRSEIARIIERVPPRNYRGLHLAFRLFGEAAGGMSEVSRMDEREF